MSPKEVRRETASLAKRYPPRGITSDIPAAVRMQMRSQEQDKANREAEKHFPSSFEPEPEPKPKPVKKAKGGMTKGYAKGGSVRGSGIAQRGVKQCKVV